MNQTFNYAGSAFTYRIVLRLGTSVSTLKPYSHATEPFGLEPRRLTWVRFNYFIHLIQHT
jgi:hypothetical protein